MAAEAKLSLLMELKNMLKGGLTKAKQDIDTGVSEMKARLNELGNKGKDTFEDLGNQVPMFGRAISLLKNPIVMVVGLLATLATVGRSAFNLSDNWDQGMAKINMTAGLAKTELKGLSDVIFETARSNYQPYEEVADAFNRIISSGLDVKTSLDFLDPSLKAAKAGFTDVETAAKAAVSVMNSSGVKDATHIYDVLFQTVKLGNAEFGEMSQYLPKIIPLAKQAGFSLEEAAGAYAYLTDSMDPMRSATALENLFKVLSQARFIYGQGEYSGFKGLGVDVFQATGKVRALKDILGDLTRTLSTMTDEQRVKAISTLGLDVESGTAIAKMTQGYKEFVPILDGVVHSEGAFNKAIDDTTYKSQNLKRIWQQLRGEMKGIGDGLLDMIEKISGPFAEFLERAHKDELHHDADNALHKEYYRSKGLPYDGSVRGSFDDEKAFDEWKRQRADKTYDTVSKQFAQDMASKLSDLRINDQVKKETGLTDINPAHMYDPLRAQAVIEKLDAWTDRRDEFGKNINTILGDRNKSLPAYIKEMKPQTQDEYDNYKANGAQYLKGIKKFLGDYNIRSTEDFYRLMQSGKLDAASGQMAALINARGSKTDNSKFTPNTTGVDKVVGNSTQQRNISIHFDSFIKGDLVSQNQHISKMSKEELKQWLAEMMKRLIANIETGYGA